MPSRADLAAVVGTSLAAKEMQGLAFILAAECALFALVLHFLTNLN